MALPAERDLNTLPGTHMTRLITAAALALIGAVTFSAQEPQEAPRPTFSSGVQLVEVYATVTDARGEPVTGLRREDFEIYENNQVQDVETFVVG